MPDTLSLEQLRLTLSSANARWEPGVTTVSGLRLAQQLRRLGVIPLAAEMARISHRIGTQVPTAVSFSPARDWRNYNGKNFVTEAKDQGNCSSCVAFALVSMMEAQARIQYNNPNWNVDLSEADLFFCGAGRKCADGWWPTYALDYAKQKGVPTDSCFRYVDIDTDCSSCADRAQQLMFVTDWQEITDINERKAHIDKVGPVFACMAVYADFFNYKRGVYHHVTGDLVGYHAICCVGYDEAQKCWICKNNWGGGWGDRGFFQIAYGEGEMESTFAMYGISGVKGTLKPTNVEPDPVQPPSDSGENWAEAIALDDPVEQKEPKLWILVDQQWRNYPLPDARAVQNLRLLFESSAVRVQYSGAQVTGIFCVKSYS